MRRPPPAAALAQAAELEKFLFGAGAGAEALFEHAEQADDEDDIGDLVHRVRGCGWARACTYGQVAVGVGGPVPVHAGACDVNVACL